jgi:hypothetical protein
VQSTQFKLASAGIGAGALITMGAFGVVFSDVSAAEPEPAPPGPVTTSEAILGETVTPTEDAEVPDPVATPEITTTPTSAEPG